MGIRKRRSRAEQQAQTRADLLAAAEHLFVSDGFHATSVDQVAERAGYSKGAVYSNFDSKEDLFLAVYERRVEEGVVQVQRAIQDHGRRQGLIRVAESRASRKRRDELWIAVLFEFWAHVIRNSRARARFVELHDRAMSPLIEAMARLAEEGSIDLPLPADRFVRAMSGMQLAVILERLIQPKAMRVEDGAELMKALFETLGTKGAEP